LWRVQPLDAAWAHAFAAEVKTLMRVATEEPHESPRGMFEHSECARWQETSNAEERQPEAVHGRDRETRHDVWDWTGGTGKTYIAVAMAVSALLTKQVNRIILARPAVEAGERLGFLPGTLQQKIDPYMRPRYDAL